MAGTFEKFFGNTEGKHDLINGPVASTLLAFSLPFMLSNDSDTGICLLYYRTLEKEDEAVVKMCDVDLMGNKRWKYFE